MSRAPLPLAILGAGLVGLRHARIAAALDGVRLTAVVEPDEALCKTLRDQGLPAVPSCEALPAGTAAAIVATPTPDHHLTGAALLARGLAVLVEKPIAGTLKDADELLAAQRASGAPLVVGHHRRCHPFVAEARKSLPRLGPMVGLQGTWCLRKHDSYFDVPWRRRPGAGPLLTNLSHEIDLLRHLAGEITEITALTSTAARGGPLEDTAAIALRFDSGALGTFLLSDAGASPWAFEAACGENPNIAASGRDALRLIGTQGALSFPSLTVWLNTRGGETEWGTPLTALPGPRLDRIDPLAAQMTRFAAVARGGSDPVLASGPDGRATLAATLAAALSAETGRPITPAQVPPGYPGFHAPARQTA